jgi:hypothetical protein
MQTKFAHIEGLIAGPSIRSRILEILRILCRVSTHCRHLLTPTFFCVLDRGGRRLGAHLVVTLLRT